MSALLQSRVSPPQVQLAPRVWAPSSPSQSAPPIPQQTLLIVASKRTMPGPVENGESVTLGRLLDGQQQNPSGSCYWFISHCHVLCSTRPSLLPNPVQTSALALHPQPSQRAPSSSYNLEAPSFTLSHWSILFQELTAQHPPDPPMSTGSPMALHNPEPGSMKCTSRVKARRMCLEQSCHQDYLVH